MANEITVCLHRSKAFTSDGWGRRVEDTGGSYDRLSQNDTSRGVTLPLSLDGLSLLSLLHSRFYLRGSCCGEFVGVTFNGIIEQGEEVLSWVLAAVASAATDEAELNRDADEKRGEAAAIEAAHADAAERLERIYQLQKQLDIIAAVVGEPRGQM